MDHLTISNSGLIQTRLHVDDDEIITEDVMPARVVGRILDENTRLRNLGRNPNPRAHGRLAARIPLPIYHNWRREWRQKYAQDWTWQTFLAMKINDRDWAKLKTNERRL